jgi:hypothetical protein
MSPVLLRPFPAVLALAIVLVACDEKDPKAEVRTDSAAVSGGASSSSSAPSGAASGDATDPDASDSSSAASTPSPAGDSIGFPAGKPMSGRRYNVKSGIVEMRSSVMADMHQTMYFDDYGMKQAVHADMKSGNRTSRSVMLMTASESVVYDPETKTGTRVDLSGALAQLGMGGIPNLSALDDTTKVKLKYKPIGARTILGRQAEGASIEIVGTPVKIWAWEGVPLRMEAAVNNQTMTIEATSIKTDVAHPANRFAVPSDVQIKDLTNAQ